MPAAEDHVALRVLMAPDLPSALVEHIDRVVSVAGELARIHRLDERRVLLAAQGHDVLRGLSPEALLEAAAVRGLEVGEFERAEPVILHGPLGAIELEARGWMDDRELLDAIRWHTTGHPDYGPIAWAMFVADKVEPAKIERWPALDAVAEAMEHSLEGAALLYLDLLHERLEGEGKASHPLAEQTRQALRERDEGSITSSGS
ncbi:MAG: HD domain-containing protein [Dehalococcoidia bacterium]